MQGHRTGLAFITAGLEKQGLFHRRLQGPVLEWQVANNRHSVQQVGMIVICGPLLS